MKGRIEIWEGGRCDVQAMIGCAGFGISPDCVTPMHKVSAPGSGYLESREPLPHLGALPTSVSTRHFASWRCKLLDGLPSNIRQCFPPAEPRMPSSSAGYTRRVALKAGFLGVTGLTLPDFLRAKALAKEKGGSGSAANDKSVILIWLDGGPSQLETFDPKPDAPAEFRGPFGVCKTRIPGVNVSALMPQVAKRIEKVSLIRSLHHDNGDHFAAGHWMTTGRFGSSAVNLPQKYPSVGSFVSKVKGSNNPHLPAYVGLPSAQTIYLFPGYMGAAY